MADIIKAFVLDVSPDKGRGTKRKREEEEEEKLEDLRKENEESEDGHDEKRAKMDEEGMCQHPIWFAR